MKYEGVSNFKVTRPLFFIVGGFFDVAFVALCTSLLISDIGNVKDIFRLYTLVAHYSKQLTLNYTNVAHHHFR